MRLCYKCKGNGCNVCYNIGYVATSVTEDIRVQVACLRDEISEIRAQLEKQVGQ